MKSRTSFSKLTIFKKNITRFAPVWALYLIGMMLVLLDNSYYSYYDWFAEGTMADLVGSFGVVNIIYAGVIALMVYGDLYNTRMCYSLHVAPLRREGILLSNLATGLSFSIVPNLLAMAYLMTRLGAYWYLALYWLLASTLQFMFFYSLATVSALLTGNRFAMIAMYALFNFVSMLLYAVTQMLYIPMMPGVVVNMEAFMQFSPAVQVASKFDYFLFERYEIIFQVVGGEESEFHYRYLGLADGWGYHAILGALSVVITGVAVWLYRLRHLECAGDFVAFSKIKGVVCVVITLCVALGCSLLGEVFATEYIIWMAVGLVIGFFGSLMLLERRIKVFRKKTFLGFGMMALVVTLSCLAVANDWFGIITWTPEADRVQSVTIANYKNSDNGYVAYGMDPGHYGNRISVTLTEENEIAEIITAHKDILEHRDDMRDENGKHKPTHYIVISYKMKGGRTVIRAYSALTEGENYAIISKYFYTPKQVLGYTDPAEAARDAQYIYAANGEIPVEFAEKFFEALQKDAVNGQVATQYVGSEKTSYVEYYLRGNDYSISRQVYLLPGATNTLALLNSPQVLMGYTDWEEYLGDVDEVLLNYETVIGSEHYAGLLGAIKTDIENGNIGFDDMYNDYVCTVVIQVDKMYRDLYIPETAENTMRYLKENAIE